MTYPGERNFSVFECSSIFFPRESCTESVSGKSCIGERSIAESVNSKLTPESAYVIFPRENVFGYAI
jgi:hypothetical protein